MTSLFPLAIAALMGSATLALAEPLAMSPASGEPYATNPGQMSRDMIFDTKGNSFALARVQANDSTIELYNVTASADGVVEIYDYNTQMVGNLLGSQVVTKGSTSEVRINLLGRPFNNVLAVMSIEGRVVAEQEIDLRRPAN